MNERQNEQFIKLINQLIEREGSQVEAERKMDVSEAYISKIINGKAPQDPPSKSWIKLYEALGVENHYALAIKNRYLSIKLSRNNGSLTINFLLTLNMLPHCRIDHPRINMHPGIRSMLSKLE